MIIGSPWLADVLAGVMLALAACAAVRLVLLRSPEPMRRRDADLVHVAMGVAMAGMFAPSLTAVPAAAWEGVFGAAAAWFAWRTVRGWRGPAGPDPHSHPAHLVGSGAMVFMTAAMPVPQAQSAAMTGMGGGPGRNAVPVLALMLAVALLGYAVVTAGELAAAPAPPGQRARVLAPRLAACSHIAMSLAMGYMLIGML